jgi:hypothetical protein
MPSLQALAVAPRGSHAAVSLEAPDKTKSIGRTVVVLDLVRAQEVGRVSGQPPVAFADGETDLICYAMSITGLVNKRMTTGASGVPNVARAATSIAVSLEVAVDILLPPG